MKANPLYVMADALPAGVLRSIGRLYDQSTAAQSVIDPVLSRFLGEGVIQRGPGTGLRIDASGRKAGYVFGTSDLQEQRVFCSLLEPGDVLYEVGANIGFFVLIGARRVGPEGCVYAFEPNPHAASQLRKNVALNSFQNVEVTEKAVFDEEGQLSLDIGGDSGKSSVGSTGPDADSVRVQSLQMDAWVGGKRAPDVIKIDVEGAEIEVLDGAIETIETCRPALLVEVHGIGRHFAQFVERQLRPLGYTASTLDGEELPDQDGIRYHAVLRPQD